MRVRCSGLGCCLRLSVSISSAVSTACICYQVTVWVAYEMAGCCFHLPGPNLAAYRPAHLLSCVQATVHIAARLFLPNISTAAAAVVS